MPRGHRDWFVYTDQYAFADIDTGEICARIGSPYVYLRGGRAIYLTGFECDVNDWNASISAGAVNPLSRFVGDSEISGLRPLRGSACAKIAASIVADGDGNKWAQANKLLPAIWSGNLGLEVSIAPDANAQRFYLELHSDDGGITRAAGICIDFVNKKLYYRSGTATVALTSFTEFADQPGGDWLPVAGQSLRWGHIKLLVDSGLTEYLDFILNGRSFADEIGGVAITTGAFPATSFDRLLIQVGVLDNDGSAGCVYFDDLVFTQDEP